MLRMRFEHWTDRKLFFCYYIIIVFLLFSFVFGCRRCCGTRIRAEMSSGRSRRDDRKRGGPGGGGDRGGGGRGGGEGRNRYR